LTSRLIGAGCCALAVVAGGIALGTCGRESQMGASGHVAAVATVSVPSPVPSVEVSAPAPPSAAPPRRRVARRAPERLVGQKLMVAYRGTVEPPADLLTRIERGEVGGVILFSENVPADGATGVRRMVGRLQDAARRGRNPPLLIATDQEGGVVKRMPGPPDRSPRELATGPVSAVRMSGRQTGRSLRRMGIGLDLAPVADLATGPSFLATRTFSPDPGRNTSASTAFAAGLQSSGVAATAKHYPGLGSSGQANTDVAAVRLMTPLGVLARERAGFMQHVAGGTRAIMMSNAVYVAYDPTWPAVTSRKIVGRLRSDGFRGVLISDDLGVPALRRFGADTPQLVTKAGVDILLYASTDAGTAYRSLLRDLRSGRIERSRVEGQVRRIIRLKRWIARAAAG
jgi:beta-N-acetylhexosaminidase